MAARCRWRQGELVGPVALRVQTFGPVPHGPALEVLRGVCHGVQRGRLVNDAATIMGLELRHTWTSSQHVDVELWELERWGEHGGWG
jgi:hypothetical protein